jgi:putative transferase (TIGR04331 family)
VSLHLIATADESTWRFDGPVLFLGEWCKVYARRDVWGGMDASTLRHVWMDFDSFERDYHYMESLYERLLPVVAAQLNMVHGVDHGVEYWRILIGPWLATFMHVVYERWRMITHALETHNIRSFSARVGDESTYIPKGMNDFHESVANDDWNGFLYLEILKYKNALHHMDVHMIPVHTSGAASQGRRTQAVKPSWMAMLKKKLVQLAVGKNDVFMISTYVPFERLAVLQLRLGQFPFRWGSAPSRSVIPSASARAWRLPTPSENSFENFLMQMIPRQIPAIFLEGFQGLLQQVSAVSWPQSPRAIFTSNALWSSELVKAYTASKVEEGSRLVYGQHGGLYGVGIFSWAEKHETDVAYRYLTWGWGQPGNSKFLPVGYFKRKLKAPTKHREDGRLVLVCYEYPRYTHRLESETMVMLGGYIDNCLEFGRSLSPLAREKLLVRLTPRESGWHQAERWRTDFPSVHIDKGQEKMNALVEASRLMVYTYNSTGFLEAFASNIPCVMFWDPAMSRVRPDAAHDFDELKRVGILHDTPQSVAAHVDAIWHAVPIWWNSSAVQTVLKKFVQTYCKVSPTIDQEIRKALFFA